MATFQNHILHTYAISNENHSANQTINQSLLKDTTGKDVQWQLYIMLLNQSISTDRTKTDVFLRQVRDLFDRS